MAVKTPRDRNGTFEPAILPKYQKRVPLFNGQVIPMYSFGMTDRDIRNHIKKIYNADVPPELISNITNAVTEDVKEWRNRPLESSCAIAYLDALRVKSRQEGKSCIKSVYAALGVNFEGRKEALGLRISENDGAKFWTGVLAELKNRGVQDILIACMDGLTGFPEAVRAAYSAPSEQAGRDALEAFGKIRNDKYPTAYQAWDRHWPGLCEFFNYPPEIRRVIYTANAIESLNYQLRKVTKNRPAFVNDEAIFKILYLAIRNASEKWTMPIRDWGSALNQFAVIFGKERVPF